MTSPDQPQKLNDRHAAIAVRIIGEILDDVRHGVLPGLPDTFSALNDHVDANEYGGMCAENIDVDVEDWVDIQEAVQDWLIRQGARRVETWLADHTSNHDAAT